MARRPDLARKGAWMAREDNETANNFISNTYKIFINVLPSTYLLSIT